MTTPLPPYWSSIQRYFPQEQWDNAACITLAECDPSQEGYPSTCVKAEQGPLQCGDSVSVDEPKSYGTFGLLDVCWDPAINPLSPVPAEWWARRMEPAINTWIASLIWSSGGWRSWTTAGAEGCNIASVPGGPIPYPRNPVDPASYDMGVPEGLLALIVGVATLAISALRK